MKTEIEMMQALSSRGVVDARKAIEEARERAAALVGGEDARTGTSGQTGSSLGSSRDDEGFAVVRSKSTAPAAVDVAKDVPGAPKNLAADEPNADEDKNGEENKPSWCVEHYEIDVKNEGLVIGQNGMTIRKLQQDIGTTIEVVKGEGKLLIKGSKEKIAYARENLDEFFRIKGPKTVTVDCKARSGLIIGNSGQTIKALKEQTGCRIEVMRDVEKCVITGPGDRVEFAKSLVEKMIADSWEVNADGDVTIVEEVVPCAYKAGAIIGPGGNTIRNIRETTGVAIDIERGADGCKAADRCRIIGTASQVKKAVDIVRQLLREMDQQQLMSAPVVPPMYAAYNAAFATSQTAYDPYAYYAAYAASFANAAPPPYPPPNPNPPPP